MLVATVEQFSLVVGLKPQILFSRWLLINFAHLSSGQLINDGLFEYNLGKIRLPKN
ncbi:hypothetical protein H1P_80048 [Hyella patelloides LEGE 07179]|uniref:Uncharacterized protein n=1 Tax=Hyella patelloides LEGE 07179 TaxID=945734 RepID=A0A563W4N8_9CYAN|nr:hypothetical protein H1P_80048 [Hyella patelloides LEGE 07179]